VKEELCVHHYLARHIGWLELIVTDAGVRSIRFTSPPEQTEGRPDHPVMQLLVGELDRYFAGRPTTFSVPLDPQVGTPFQKRVWEELTRIPYGETRSYGEVAAAMGSPRAARAVGSANRSNTIPIVVPCHRVIKGDGGLGGYDSGVEIKRKLLRLEQINRSVD
jgi:methylated-DNA-[protein]-cysteine S-methyltransferase